MGAISTESFCGLANWRIPHVMERYAIAQNAERSDRFTSSTSGSARRPAITMPASGSIARLWGKGDADELCACTPATEFLGSFRAENSGALHDCTISLASGVNSGRHPGSSGRQA